MSNTAHLIQQLLGNTDEVINVNDLRHAAAKELERLTQPVGVETLKLFDSHWVNIVNQEHCYENYDKEEAVHLAVKLTEAKMAELHAETVARLQAERADALDEAKHNAETVARLIAERDAAIKHAGEVGFKWAEVEQERDALQEQVKTLRGALLLMTQDKWHWERIRDEALAATEPKENMK